MSETITISLKEYNKLIADSNFLNRLHNAGVDNWDGYHYGYDDEDEDDYGDLR